MSLRSIENVLRNESNAVTILPRDVAAELVLGGVCAVLPYKLTWNLPPVSFFVPQHMVQHPTVSTLAAVIRTAALRLPGAQSQLRAGRAT
jgi:hypothetical protein